MSYNNLFLDFEEFTYVYTKNFKYRCISVYGVRNYLLCKYTTVHNVCMVTYVWGFFKGSYTPTLKFGVNILYIIYTKQ
jgi:hypothetical protein